MLIPLLVSALASTCEPGPTTPGGEPARTEAMVACNDVCTDDDRVCAPDRSPAHCWPDCHTVLDGITDFCQPLARDLFLCKLGWPPVCQDDGSANRYGCDAEYTDLVNCILGVAP
jgi:hypothetical protein